MLLASVHAALGGQTKPSVSIYPIPIYLWGKELCIEWFDERYHQFIEADVLSWLRQCRDKFDMIFIDPPTFKLKKDTRCL